MSDFTYTEYVSTGFNNHGWSVIVDECALSYSCKTEADAYYAAIEQVDAIKAELVEKLEKLTGEFYDD